MEQFKTLLQTKILEVASKSPNTREITMLVHRIDVENGNGLTFTMDATEKYMQTLVDKPVVVGVNTQETDFTDHEPIYDDKGNIVGLDTIPVGVITEAWIGDYQINDIESVKALMAKATIWSYKFPTVVEIMENLLNKSNLSTSVEVEIISYTEDSTRQHRKTNEIEYLGNCMLGSIVKPADNIAKVTEIFYREVAQAFKKDLSSSTLQEESLHISNGGVVMKFTKEMVINEMSYERIKEQLYSLLNPEEWRYGIAELFQSYVIIYDYETSKLYKQEFSVGESVSLVGDKFQVEIVYQPIQENNEVVVSDLVEQLVEQKQTVDELSKLKTDVENLNTQLNEKENSINQLTTVVSEKETTIQELNTVVDELKEYKEKLEQDKIQHEIAQIKEKYIKLLSKEKFESEEVQNLITERKISELNSLVVLEIESKILETSTQKPNSDDVVVSASQSQDLIPETVLSKYGFSN